MLEFDFLNRTKYLVNKKQLQSIADKFCKTFFDDQDIHISVSIVSAGEIIKLNKKIFKKATPTDVISLESKSQISPKSLGEIIICASVAQKQAKERGHSLQKEIKILFIHGLIHLLGLNHETQKEKKYWRKILAKF